MQYNIIVRPVTSGRKGGLDVAVGLNLSTMVLYDYTYIHIYIYIALASFHDAYDLVEAHCYMRTVHQG